MTKKDSFLDEEDKSLEVEAFKDDENEFKFFLLKLQNKTIKQKSKQIRIGMLKESQYFGEIALMTNIKRTATVKSLDYIQTVILSRQDLNKAKEEASDIYNAIREQIP